LESLGFVLIELLLGELPWTKFETNSNTRVDRERANRQIAQGKRAFLARITQQRQTTSDEFEAEFGIPKVFGDYLYHVRSLRPEHRSHTLHLLFRRHPCFPEPSDLQSEFHMAFPSLFPNYNTNSNQNLKQRMMSGLANIKPSGFVRLFQKAGRIQLSFKKFIWSTVTAPLQRYSPKRKSSQYNKLLRYQPDMKREFKSTKERFERKNVRHSSFISSIH
jgi:hypothetical protein